MTASIPAAAAPESPVPDEIRPAPPGPMDHVKSVPPTDLALVMREVVKRSGKSYLAQAREIWKLYLGHGGVTPFEYFYYNLYDDDLTLEQKKAFVGKKLRTKVTNHVLDDYYYGFGLDKIAFYACMKGLGLPIPETRALFHPSRFLDKSASLRSAAEFEAYLRLPEHYPFFSKPADATASLGAASADAYHKDSDELELANGARFTVAHFVSEAARYFNRGYLIQERLRPHPEIERITGKCLSTVRVLVLADEGAPQIIRATWRVPVGNQYADVHWRGNLMAAIDVESGAVHRVVRGSGLDRAEVDVHPQSGIRLLGHTLPMWPSIRETTLRAAAALPNLQLMGWDVSITDQGPVLIELEPDGGETSVTQLASGQGLLDGPYGEFLEHRKAKKKRA